MIAARLTQLEKPKDFIRLVEYKVIRQQYWRRFLAPRVRALSDDRFRTIMGEAGSEEDVMRRVHEQVRHRFFFQPGNRKEFFGSLLTRTQSPESILEDAQAILANTFTTLGSGRIDLGNTINWQKDFKSGIEWPLEPTHDLDLEDLGHASDVKVPWELSRFHQVWWLGKAYWHTQNEQYAIRFRDLIDDWIEKNPPGVGVNWANGMEASVRAANVIAGYYFFCESQSISPEFWFRLLKSLYAHGVFIEQTLEFSWRNHNHLLSDLAGLVFLGVFFQHRPWGAHWLRRGMALLEEEMIRQVTPDGVDWEKSTSYHRLVLELFYASVLLAKRNGVEFSAEFMTRLERMFTFVRAYSRPDGSIPLIGDADDGRLFRYQIQEPHNDHRHALCIGALLFHRPDFKHAADSFHQEALWLTGCEGFEQWQLLRAEAPVQNSQAFSEGGFYVMRSEGTHVLIDAGDIGQRGRGGHGHNDTLSFTYWHQGRDVVVDSGTYAYTSNARERNEFRSVRAHNTVCVDGMEISEFDGLWEIKKDRTKTTLTEWKSVGETDVLEAVHFGYMQIPGQIVHRRQYILQKDTGRLSIRDVLTGEGIHTAQWFLHLHPDVVGAVCQGSSARFIINGLPFYVASTNGSWSLKDVWYSPSYGIRIRSKVLTLVLEQALPMRMEIEIEPLEKIIP